MQEAGCGIPCILDHGSAARSAAPSWIGEQWKNALFDQTFPEQLYHLTPLIFKNVRWSIKNGEEWSSSLFPSVIPQKSNDRADGGCAKQGKGIVPVNKNPSAESSKGSKG